MDWQPSATLTTLRRRAEYLQQIRRFFYDRDYLEVDTPAMAACGGTDIYLDNITARFRDCTRYLQTSPEYHMKRLLAAGSGPVFQIARAFRDDELGRWHNPEFTMLEWYRPGIDHHQLLDEVEALLQVVLHTAPMQRTSYRHLFLEYCRLDPFQARLEDLQKAVNDYGLEGVLPAGETNPDAYLFLLMAERIEPELARKCEPLAVLDFPASQAALARVEGEYAQRFEVYYAGIELANGFHELTDAQIQRQRFTNDNRHREVMGKTPMALDERFLEALAAGVPACSGVALGVDRLLAIALGEESVAKVMAFAHDRA